MNTNDRHEEEREDRPRAIHPDEVNTEHPGKKLKSQEKIDIRESEFGRASTQDPQDEKIEDNLSQVDEGTIKLQEQKKEHPDQDLKEEINEIDNRDRNDSTQDWDAENSRTGRHK
ncbi:hypothetical protein [Flavobacterium soli]|uniref:hypothetical protein n=1 Tax=Flavobacterium soli TaxID=344881 RepID=UPI0004098378|nr:hypothetical protein [Flavobacterium soli]